MRRDEGFTLIELMVAMSIAVVLMTLSALALRSFWFAQSLKGASDILVGELRNQQEESVSQSHPLVFGVGVTDGATQVISYRFDPDAAAPRCTATPVPFDSGVFTAAVVVESFLITNDTMADEYVDCQAAASSDRIVFFYARGTSNGGTIVLEQPNTLNRRSMSVSGLTGRVTRT